MADNLLRTLSTLLGTPVIVLLLLLGIITLGLIGAVLGEYFAEHRFLSEDLPLFLDSINDESLTEEQLRERIGASGLLRNQKAALIELTMHPRMTIPMLEALADRLLDESQEMYDRRLKLSDYIAKLGPILGLMGTLIPLGPGIMALSTGDTATLSASLLTAFDTTVAGLFAAGVATVISGTRKSWYDKYMSILEASVDCILEVEKKRR